MTARNLTGNSDTGRASNSVPEFLPEGFVTCPYCNHDNQNELVDIYTAVDPKVYPDSELPNVYVVSVVRCNSCGFSFDLPRVDVRFWKGE